MNLHFPSSATHRSLPVKVTEAAWVRTAAPEPWYVTLPPSLGRVIRSVWTYLVHADAIPLLKKRQRRLRVSETLSLGDKRFVSILEVDGQSFLVGGSGAGIALLASLATEQVPPFESVLRDSLQRGEVR